MDKSNKLISVAMMALVFLLYNVAIGSGDAIGDTFKSLILVGSAMILTWLVIREQKKRGRMSI